MNRPPSGNTVNFVQTLEEICYTVRSQAKFEILFGSDININLNKRDLNSRKYQESLKMMRLKQMIKDITYIFDSNIHTGLLDHIVSSDLNLYDQLG